MNKKLEPTIKKFQEQMKAISDRIAPLDLELPKISKEAQSALEKMRNSLENFDLRDMVQSQQALGKVLQEQQRWPMVELGDDNYFTIESGGTPSTKEKSYWDGDIAWVTLVDIPSVKELAHINKTKRSITKLGLKKSRATLLPKGSVIVSSRATIGRIAVNKVPLATNQGFKNIIIKNKSRSCPFFIANILRSKVQDMEAMSSGSTFKEISKTNFSKIKIPLPLFKFKKKLSLKSKAIKKSLMVQNKLLTTGSQLSTLILNGRWWSWGIFAN